MTATPLDEHPFLERPHRTLLGMAMPVLFGILAEPATGLVDTWFVKEHGGEQGLAALGIGVTVVTGSLWLFNFLGVSGQTEVSRALGSGQRDRLKDLVAATLGLATVLGAIAGLFLWGFAGSIADWFTNDPATRQDVVDYLRIRAWGAPAVLWMGAGAGLLRGFQDMRRPMVLALLANALNVGLDAVLVPRFGLNGAAQATAIAQGLCGVATVWLLFRLVGGVGVIRAADLRPLSAVGRDMFLRTGSLQVFLLVSTRSANDLGSTEGAVHQVVRSIWMLTAVGLDAWAYATQSLCGLFRGAGRLDLARRAATVGVVQSLIVGFLISAGMAVAADAVVQSFAPDESGPEFAVLFGTAWWIALASQPLNAVSFGTDGVHWAMGDYAWLRTGMVIATVLGVGALWLGGGSSLDGVWIVTALWIASRAAFGLLRIWPGVGKAPLRQSRSIVT